MMLVRTYGRQTKLLSRQLPLLSGNACSQRHRSAQNSFIRIHDEVRDALNTGKPVVALETTIYTHGFPYPDNVALASHLESVVRVNGAVPATIGILDGIAHVGLEAEDLIKLTSSAGKDTTLKLSRRDLGFVCGMRLAGKNFNGGTTIAGTMILAHLAGIKVFATGGLGGVHRGAETSMDISADLTELGRTPVSVISSGCKSFLDIPRTLEYLETEGVGVGTFADGRKGNVDFPAFWSRDSGSRSPTTIQDEKEAAAIIHAQHSLPVHSGLLFANPIPEEWSIPKSEMDVIIAEAIKDAEKAGAAGKDNTPFILAKIKELSGSKSVKANRALIESNVRVGTIVAKELAILEASQREASSGTSSTFMPAAVAASPLSDALPREPKTLESASNESATASPESQPDVIVAGALAVDLACDYAPFTDAKGEAQSSPQRATSNPARISQSLGGVGHNIAKALHHLGSKILFLSTVGDDLSGRAAIAQLSKEGFDTTGISTLPSASGQRTAQYVAVNDNNKDLVLAMADMSIFESDSSSVITSKLPALFSSPKPPQHLVIDGNWSRDASHAFLSEAKALSPRIHTAFEPVSTAKASRFIHSPPDTSPLPVFPNHLVDLATPNEHELKAMHDTATSACVFEREDWWCVTDALGIPSTGLRVRLAQTTSSALVDEGVPQRSIQLLPFMPTILTKLGAKGVLLTMLLPAGDERLSGPEYAPYVLARCNNGSKEVGGLYVRLFEPEEKISPEDIVSVNGVGDTFLGTVIAGMAKGKGVEDCVGVGQKAAALTLRSREAVSPAIAGLKQLL